MKETKSDSHWILKTYIKPCEEYANGLIAYVVNAGYVSIIIQDAIQFLTKEDALDYRTLYKLPKTFYPLEIDRKQIVNKEKLWEDGTG